MGLYIQQRVNTRLFCAFFKNAKMQNGIFTHLICVLFGIYSTWNPGRIIVC